MSYTARVAIVDDNHAARRSLTRLITSAGYEVCAFPSAQEFLACSERERVSCVLADLVMPMNGLELQQQLAATQPHLSLVFISGHGEIPSALER